jgi:hypothetical protein
VSAIKKAVGVVADAVRAARGEQSEIHAGTVNTARAVISRRAPAPAPNTRPEDRR